MRIASVEQIELGNIMELSIAGQVPGGQDNPVFLEEYCCAKRMDGICRFTAT